VLGNTLAAPDEDGNIKPTEDDGLVITSSSVPISCPSTGTMWSSSGSYVTTTSSGVTSSADVDERFKAEIMSARADLAAQLRPFVSERWLLTNIFDFTEDEAATIELQRRYEATERPSVGGDLEPLTKAKVELLQARIEELEKAENDRKDIDYFRRNLHTALKIPENYMSIPKVEIGPDDILVFNVGVLNVPASEIRNYLERLRKNLGPYFERAGLKGRMLYSPNREKDFDSFSVLGITRRSETPTARVDVAEKRKFPPPIM